MKRATDLLFVYGTLRKGFSLHRYLEKEKVRLVAKGRIRGRLYDLGEYPGARPAGTARERIEGELYRLLEPVKQLRKLDRLEGFSPRRPKESLFVRKKTAVRTQDGRRLRAWAYFLPRKPDGAHRVLTGDYAEAATLQTSA